MKVKELLFEYISPDISYQIVNGDSLPVLKKLEDGKFDLIITSPPYNVGKSYETKTSIEKYLETQEEIINELIRTLSDKGNLCWQVGNYVNKGEVFPLDIYYYQIFKKHGLKLRNRIIWHFGHGLHASKRFSGRYETILWFSKTNDYIFNLDNVRVPAKYPGKRHFKGDKKGLPSGKDYLREIHLEKIRVIYGKLLLTIGKPQCGISQMLNQIIPKKQNIPVNFQSN